MRQLSTHSLLRVVMELGTIRKKPVPMERIVRATGHDKIAILKVVEFSTHVHYDAWKQQLTY